MTINEMEELPPPTLIARFDEEFNELPNQFWEYSENITEITFESTINVPSNAYRSWDVSENQNNSIVAYIIDDGLEANSYHLYSLLVATVGSCLLLWIINKLK